MDRKRLCEIKAANWLISINYKNMEIISTMKVLIIFFIVLVILFLIILFSKFKICFDIAINDFEISFKIIFFKKEFKGRFLLKKVNKISKINNANKKKRIQLKNKEENIKYILEDVVSILEINKLNIDIILGTPFIGLTIFLLQIINVLIPSSFCLPFKSKKNLSYKVVPQYNKFKLRANICGEIKISIYQALLIFTRYFVIK